MHTSTVSIATATSAKAPNYYRYVRTEILRLLPRHFGRLLDVGCGEGATARYLKDNGYCEWAAGIELSPQAAAAAREKLDLVIETDLNSPMLPAHLAPVDVILCLDILEHLVDPWRCVEWLQPLLSPTGLIIASIPNVRNVRVLLPLLLLGRWDYVEAGILDSTHLRFFTRRSAIALLSRDGLAVQEVRPRCGRYMQVLNTLTLSLFSDFLATQFLIRAARRPAAGALAHDH